METFKPQKRFEDKQKAKGFTRVAVWVPETKRAALSAYAAKLRKESKK